MKTTVQIKQVTIQNKEQKIVVLGKASQLTLGNDGNRSTELNCRPAQTHTPRLN